jgi:hypothetical protein
MKTFKAYSAIALIVCIHNFAFAGFVFEEYFNKSNKISFILAKKNGDIELNARQQPNAYLKLKGLCSVYVLACESFLNALAAFETGQLHLFDAVVGDSQCQSRAIHLSIMYTHYTELDSELHDSAGMLREQCSKAITIMRSILKQERPEFLTFLQEKCGYTVGSAFTLNDFLEATQAMVLLNNVREEHTRALQFITLCYFNVAYQSRKSTLECYDLDTYRIAYDLSSLTELKQDRKCKRCKSQAQSNCSQCSALICPKEFVNKIEETFADSVKKTIAALSQRFLELGGTLLDPVYTNDSHWLEIKKAIGQEYLSLKDKYKISPAYMSMKALLFLALYHKRPFIIRIHYYDKNGKKDPYVRYFFYKVTTQNVYELCRKDDVENQAVILMYGISFPGEYGEWRSKFSHDFEEWARNHKSFAENVPLEEESSTTVDPFKLISGFQASDPHTYYASAKTVFDNKAFPLVNQMREQEKQDALKNGWCDNAMTHCRPDHMYCVVTFLPKEIEEVI